MLLRCLLHAAPAAYAETYTSTMTGNDNSLVVNYDQNGATGTNVNTYTSTMTGNKNSIVLNYGADGFGTQADLVAINKRMTRLNNEDMRVKRGRVDGTDLVLEVEDMAKSNGRPTIYKRDVRIDVSELNQSAEVADNTSKIITNTTDITINNAKTGITSDQADHIVNNNAKTGITSDQANQIVNNRVDINDLKQRDINTNKRIDNIFISMDDLEKNLSGGIASSIAIGQHQFDPSYKGGGQVSVAAGFYNGENALSLAAGVPVGERAFFSTSLATDSGNKGVSMGIGLTYRLK